MNTETLACAIVGHLVGDYLLQNDWMAINKKKSSFPCLVHCFLWTLAVAIFAQWNSFVVMLVLFSTHFIQDRTSIIAWWMSLRWKDQSEFMRCDKIEFRDLHEPIVKVGLGPWSIIVVDNVWHILTIWAVWRFVA